MKNYYNTHIFLLITFLSFSCSNGKIDREDVIIIPLVQSLSQSKVGENCGDIVKEYRIIPLETSDSVLLSDGLYIYNIADSQIVLTDYNSVYFFRLTDGRFSHKFNKKGNGPGEYISISDLIYDSDHQKIYIHDFNKRTINVYSQLGTPLSQFRNDSIASMRQNKEGQFIVSYASFEKNRHLIGIYDSNWQHIGSYMENTTDNNVFGLYNISTINLFNGDPYIYMANTLYQISTEGVSPVLILNKGLLGLPDEIASDIRRKNERNKYIWGDYGYLSGNYYFLFFVYNEQSYFDLWDTSSRSLLCRNIVTRPGETGGLPFVLSGKRIYAFPKFVQNNRLYCILPIDQASIIYPQYNEDDNPLILEIVL